MPETNDKGQKVGVNSAPLTSTHKYTQSTQEVQTLVVADCCLAVWVEALALLSQ